MKPTNNHDQALRTLRAELTEYCRYTGADFLSVMGREVSEQRRAGICL